MVASDPSCVMSDRQAPYNPTTAEDTNSQTPVSDATLTRSFIPDKHIQNEEAQHQEWCWALYVSDADLLTSSSSEDAKCTETKCSHGGGFGNGLNRHREVGLWTAAEEERSSKVGPDSLGEQVCA